MHLPPLPYPFAEVPRLHRPSEEQLGELAWRAEPAILTGLLDGPFLAELGACGGTPEKVRYLKTLLGDAPVRMTAVPREAHGYLAYAEDGFRRNFSEQGTTFPLFAQRLEEALADARAGAVYMQAQPVTAFPELERRLPPPELIAERDAFARNIWVGSGGHTVNIHFDQYDNYICMYEGTKRVVLFPPQTLPDMYVGPLDRAPAGAPASLVRLLAADFERFPRFRNVLPQGRVAVVNPGEVLWVPPLWWHHVESFGLNVMVNSWLHDIKHQLFQEFMSSLFQGIVLFSEVPADVRERLRWMYRWLVFRDATTQVSLGQELRERLTPEQLAAIPGHLLRCTSFFDRLPEAWQEQLSVFFDYFVFQTAGDPLPTLPGEFARMTERLRGLGAA